MNIVLHYSTIIGSVAVSATIDGIITAYYFGGMHEDIEHSEILVFLQRQRYRATLGFVRMRKEEKEGCSEDYALLTLKRAAKTTVPAIPVSFLFLLQPHITSKSPFF